MKVNHFSSEHRVRLRDFFRQTQDYTRQHASDKLMLQMSAQLLTVLCSFPQKLLL